MNLAIDRGNTRTKAAIFDGDKVVFEYVSKTITGRQLASWLKKFPVKNAIISHVKDHPASWDLALKVLRTYIQLDHHTPLPFKNIYTTPETLGRDRIALLAGAKKTYPGKNVLTIGVGTCITFNFMDNKGHFIGGSIHPGLQMRFWAMHTYTGKLPLIKFNTQTDFIGNSTESAMTAGVLWGTCNEIDGIIDLYKEKYPDLVVLIAGGDSALFVSMLKNKIFAVPNLVLTGLNQILNYNVIR